MVNQNSLLDGGEPLEMERKFLVSYPDQEKLRNYPDARCVEIEQKYLYTKGNVIRRIRILTENGKKSYYYTEKIRVSAVVRIERESEITFDEYTELLKEVAPDSFVINKTRYYLKGENGVLFEVDIYPQWKDRAVVEAELPEENAAVELPDVLEQIREVTNDPRYRNEYLAFFGFDF